MELKTHHGEAGMDGLKDSAIEAILEQLIKEGPNGVAPAFASLFELAMQIPSVSWAQAITSAPTTGAAMPMATSPSGSIPRQAR
jgi:hypothetical protein